MSYRGKVGDVVEIERGDGEMSSFEWRIPDFLSLAGEEGDRYESPYFDACNLRWFFQIYPKGLAGIPSGWVPLFFFRSGPGPPRTLDVTLGIRGEEGVENKRERIQEFSYDDRACFWCKFCTRSELGKQECRLAPGNVLIISLDLKSAMPRIIRDNLEASTQRDEDCKKAEDPTEENQSSEKRGGEKALEDLGKFFTSGEKSDVTIQVGDVEFKVHSQILFARCPALSVSLQHESREKESSRIVIEDCEPDVFQSFLHQLYTGSVPSLTEQNVFGLYRVADKYLVDDLKEQCVEHIQGTLSVQTFCDSMKLALAHGERGLLQKAIDFATKNIRSIVCSVEWQNFIREYPTEANEIFIKSLGPPSGSQ